MPDRIDGLKMTEASLDLPEAMIDAVRYCLKKRKDTQRGVGCFSYSLTNGEVKVSDYTRSGPFVPLEVCTKEVLSRSELPEIVILITDNQVEVSAGKFRSILQVNGYENTASKGYAYGQFYEGNGDTPNGEVNLLFIREESNFLYDFLNKKSSDKKPFWKFW